MELKNYNFGKNVNKILDKLNKNGNSGYIVGGSLRDILLGIEPKDFDFTTNMNYSELKTSFSKYPCKEVGKAFGILMVKIDNSTYEIAKFRTDIGSSDGRHPDSVEYVNNIEQDLSRRDFTINAMAYNKKDGLIDLFGGQQDLANKIIRFIGNPSDRLQEDGLRLLRAFRFMAKLGFEFEENTEKAIKNNFSVLEKISIERIVQELNKIVVADYATQTIEKMKEIGLLEYLIPEIKLLYDFNQNNPYHKFTLWEHSINVFSKVPNDLTLRWAALLHDIGKPDAKSIDETTGFFHFYKHELIGADIAKNIMIKLRQPKKLCNDLFFLVANHMELHRNQTDYTIKKIISKIGYKNTKRLIELTIADDDSKGYSYDRNSSIWEKFNSISDVPTITDLKISGYDLINLGFVGNEIEIQKEYLLDKVLRGKVTNEHDTLINFLIHKIKSEKQLKHLRVNLQSE